ncbi:MAG: peptidylprolyl isomerase [Acidobacteriota bacterium]|nr:peptidylprolyl isomerase [Acidobacteriota bacterium]
MNLKLLFLILSFSLLGFACNNASTNANSTQAKKTNSNSQFPFTENAKPIADPEVAVIETDFGTFKMELYSNIAPKMVGRFKELAREGFYDGTAFHRVNQQYGIAQGGDPLSKDADPTNDGTGSSNKPNVPAEFSDVPYEKGIVGAARTSAPDTANCQFFIMTKRQPQFDKLYTVFGKVYEDPSGAVNLIAGSPTVPGTERPTEPIRIKSITFQQR